MQIKAVYQLNEDGSSTPLHTLEEVRDQINELIETCTDVEKLRRALKTVTRRAVFFGNGTIQRVEAPFGTDYETMMSVVPRTITSREYADSILAELFADMTNEGSERAKYPATQS